MEERYAKFERIDGSHPWRKVSREGYVDYPARQRQGGRVIYFNYPLARELGLIPPRHPARMNRKLEEAILKAFSLQIINEYEQKQDTATMQQAIEGRRYMATRYLQSQHKNKQGKTSGDGRSIWNGYIQSGRMTFDVSSRGTGATILSPGAQEAGRPLKTGTETYGYSSGLADLEEMLAGAIMSEIFYRKGIPTERTLTVIDFKDNTAIGVRTAPNLIRPAHIFRYVKLSQYNELNRSFDYFLKRQEDNGVWSLPKKREDRYEKSLEYFARTYARLAAVMEEEYIFNWLAWDGDNMLAEGAILDYGSIRQFAAKHNKYRYDDVDRFSTCLTEQRYWARKQVQTFVQIVNFILTKKKKNLQKFEKHPSLAIFDRHFTDQRDRRMLFRIGFTDKQADRLLRDHQERIVNFRQALNYFEHIKTIEGEQEVPDGVDHPPVFLVRHLLRELPKFLLKKRHDGQWPLMPPDEFCYTMAASYVNKKDLQLTPSRERKAIQFQELYQQLIKAAGRSPNRVLDCVGRRSAVINYEYRGTGDGLTWIVKEAIAMKSRIDRQKFQAAIDRFIESQVLIPGKWKPLKPRELKGPSPKARHLRLMQEIMETYDEAI